MARAFHSLHYVARPLPANVSSSSETLRTKLTGLSSIGGCLLTSSWPRRRMLSDTEGLRGTSFARCWRKGRCFITGGRELKCGRRPSGRRRGAPGCGWRWCFLPAPRLATTLVLNRASFFSRPILALRDQPIMRTVPLEPSMRITSPVFTVIMMPSTPTTAGIPYSRAYPAVMHWGPPRPATRPLKSSM